MKRAILEHLPVKPRESFFIQQFDFPFFDTPWHYHPEYELVYIEKSWGSRLVGSSYTNFREGDLSFIGSNLPHIYTNGSEFYQGNPKLRAKSTVIHFLDSSFGRDFLNVPECEQIKDFLASSQSGFHIKGDMRLFVIEQMRQMLETKGVRRMLHLIEILAELSASSELELITENPETSFNNLDNDRLGIVFQHILNNFDQQIKLEKMAELVFMTRTSFCRYFKERTKRTFVDFLMDVRLNHAAKLLTEHDQSISMTAFESGYNNLTNFNRQFKKKYSLSPQNYRIARRNGLPSNRLP